MAHSNRSRFPQRSARKTMVWNVGPESSAVQTSSTAGLTIIDTGQVASGGVTVVRLRGEFTIWLRLATAIGDGFTAFALGVGVATTDAFSVGATALPSPTGDPDWGGWWYYSTYGALVSDSTTENFQGPMSAIRIPIDTKAMRKIQPNETIFAAIGLNTEIGTATADFVFRSRMLVKLP